MKLPRLSPDALIEELNDQAREAYVDTFPHVDQADTLEADAAAFIQSAADLMQDIVTDGGSFADRAKAVLGRQS